MNQSRVSRLTGLFDSGSRLSECGSLDGFLSGMLVRLSAEFGCGAGIFFLHRGDPADCDWIAWAGHGVGDDFRDGYPRYFRDDPFAHWLVAHHDAIPRVTTGARLVRYDRFVRLPIYEEFFRPHGIHHILNVNLVGRGGAFGHLCLYRPPGSAGFRARDFELAGLMAPMLQATAGRVLAEVRLDQCKRGLEALGRRTAQGATLLLDGAGRPLFADARARHLLARYSMTGDWRAALAGELGAALLRCCREQGPSGGAERCELQIRPGRPGITCRIERIAGGASCLVELQAGPSAPPLGPMHAHGLSRREQDVAGAAALGRTNEEVAAALCISVNTVQTHLKSIYRKLEVRNRAELVRCLAAAGD